MVIGLIAPWSVHEFGRFQTEVAFKIGGEWSRRYSAKFSLTFCMCSSAVFGVMYRRAAMLAKDSPRARPART